MSDHSSKPDKTLSEISHLFLSSVRERLMQGAGKPVRRPPAQQPAREHDRPEPRPEEPARPEAEIDLTPEEFAQVIAGPEPAASQPIEPSHVPVAALLAGNLGGELLRCAREYASRQAAGGARIGLVELDACEFRLWLYESAPHFHPSEPPPATIESLDARRMTEALSELANDVDQWFVLLPSPRATEARTLLRALDRWVLLSSSDHEGIVAAYRALKGLSESHRRNEAAGAALPRLSIAVLDADADGAARVFGKLAAVCEQFLHWPIEADAPPGVPPGAARVSEQLVLDCRSTRDKAQLAAAPQWQAMQNFLKHLETITPRPKPVPHPKWDPQPSDVRAVAQDYVARAPAAAPADVPPAQGPEKAAPGAGAAEVIELPTGSCTPQAIVSAVLRGGGDLVQCPIHPPMCPQASLAVSRERRLVLVAVARQGLADLRAIGEAYRWLIQNRPLIGMAVPQFAIDAHQLPCLHLLVDHADMSADVLQPMLQSTNVTVHAYRKLRWGDRTGLLLEAA